MPLQCCRAAPGGPQSSPISIFCACLRCNCPGGGWMIGGWGMEDGRWVACCREVCGGQSCRMTGVAPPSTTSHTPCRRADHQRLLRLQRRVELQRRGQVVVRPHDHYRQLAQLPGGGPGVLRSLRRGLRPVRAALPRSVLPGYCRGTAGVLPGSPASAFSPA